MPPSSIRENGQMHHSDFENAYRAFWQIFESGAVPVQAPFSYEICDRIEKGSWGVYGGKTTISALAVPALAEDAGHVVEEATAVWWARCRGWVAACGKVAKRDQSVGGAFTA